MELKQLEYFVRVAEAGSFTKAAAILHITQPVLSRHVRQLEDSLHTRLLIRTGRGARVTEEGERLLVQGRGILRQVARAREEIAGLRNTMAGRVAIGMPMGIAIHLALPVARLVRERFPDLELTITQARSAALQDWLSAGRIDLAVLLDVPFTPHVENVPLATNRLVLVRPSFETETSPIPLAEVHMVPLIIQGQSNAIRRMLETELGRFGRKPRIAMEIDNLQTIVQLAKEGFGSAIVGLRSVEALVAPGDVSIRPIVEPELNISLHLAVPVRPLPRAHRAVVEVVKEVSRATLRPIEPTSSRSRARSDIAAAAS